MLSLLIRLLRFGARTGGTPGGWRLHRNSRDHRFLVADRHAFLVSVRRSHPSDAHLFFKEQAAFDDEHLFDNRDDYGVALFSDGRYRVDMPTYLDSIDLHRLVSERCGGNPVARAKGRSRRRAGSRKR